MKNPVLWVGGLLCLLAVQLSAQVTVEVLLEQDQFLPGESLPAAARIVNRSGQTLKMGGQEGWLTFAIESREGSIVLKSGEAPVAGEFTLESSQRATKRVDLAPYFSLGKSGRYAVTATVFIKEWNQQITSKPKPFDVVEGAKLWEQEVGLPPLPGVTNQVPETRRYTLQQANYLKQLMLYVRLTDGSGKIQKVFPIGPMISFGSPRAQIDKFSNLQLLYQDGAKTFKYTVINPQGTVIIRQSYDYTTRPKLIINSEDIMTVTGGTRRVSADDVPRRASIESEAP